MALKKISLSGLVDALDETESEFADFFRPMLGYEAVLTLYDGIDDVSVPLITEIEDELGFEFPSDLINFYMCTNGGKFGDLQLFPLTTDKSAEYSMHRYNVLDSSLKESLNLDKNVLLVGKYSTGNNCVICRLNKDKVYTYQLWDSAKRKVLMEFDYLIQLVALEVSYVTDPDSLIEFANEGK